MAHYMGMPAPSLSLSPEHLSHSYVATAYNAMAHLNRMLKLQLLLKDWGRERWEEKIEREEEEGRGRIARPSSMKNKNAFKKQHCFLSQIKLS